MLRPTVLTFVLVIIGLVLTNQAYGQGDRLGGRRGSNTERESNRGSDKPSDSNGESSGTVTRLDDSRASGDMHGSRSRGDSNDGSRSRGDSNDGSRSRGDSNDGSRSRGDSNDGSRSRGDSNDGSRSRGDSNDGSRSRGDSNDGSRSRGDSNDGSRSRGDSNDGSRSRGDSNRVPTLGDNTNIVQRQNPPVSSDSNVNSMSIRNPNTVWPVSTNDASYYSNDPRINRNYGSFGNRFEERPIVPNRDRIEPYGPYQRGPAYGRYSYGYNGYESPYRGYYGPRRYPGNRFFNDRYDGGYRQPYGRYRRSDVDGTSDSVFYAKNWNLGD